MAVIMGIFDFVFRTKGELAIVLDWQRQEEEGLCRRQIFVSRFLGGKISFLVLAHDPIETIAIYVSILD